MQFSSYIVENARAVDTAEELKNYLIDKYKDVKIEFTDRYAFAIIKNENNRHWKYWLFKQYGSLLFVSYNCAETDIGKEDITINDIIKELNP